MRNGRINWNLIIVLFLAVVAVAITSIGLRNYHRKQRVKVGLQEGLAAYEEGRWQDAASYLGQYLAVNSNDVDILLKYAQSHIRIQPFKREYLAQAINAYRVVLRVEDNTQAADELVNLYLQFGMPAEAELIARRFLDNDPDNQFHQSLAVSLVRQRKYEQSLEVLTEMVQRDPSKILGFKLLGDIAEKRPDLTSLKAGAWYEKAVQENPDLAQAYILRSQYLNDQGKPKEAFADLERAEACDLSDVNTRLSLAATWLRQRQFDRAKAHLEAVRATDPSNEGLWQIWAVLAGEMGDDELIAFVADEGIAALGPENYGFLALAAELYVQVNQIQRAQECVTQLNKADAERATILYLEGLIAQSKTDWAQAIQKWKQAIQLGYSSEMVYLNLADTLDQINNRPMAIQLLRRYTSQHEGAFRAHLRLSQLFAKDRNWQDALEQVTASVQLNPVSLEARVLYWRCRIEMMDTAKEVDATVIRQAIDRLIIANDSLPSRMLLYYWASSLGRFEQAEQILDDIEKTFGTSQSVILSRARLLMLQDKTPQAFTLLEQGVQKYPQSGEIVQLLVWGYSRDKQYDKAIKVLEDVSQTAANAYSRRQYHLWVAEVLTLAGRQDEAVDVYLKMAQENASDIFVRRQLLTHQLKTADIQQLQQWVDEIKSAESEDGWQWKYEQARLWFTRAENFERHYTEIVKLLNENISINAEDQGSRILLASSHERAGNVQLAISLYQDATPRQSENIEFIIAAVDTMYRAQEFRQAQAMLTRAAESGVWDSRLAKYELRNTLRTGTEDSAMTVLEKMTAEAPADHSARLSLAILQTRSGQLDQARANIEAVLSEQPDSAAAVAAMADLYLKQEKPRQALKLCDDYLAQYDSLQGHLMRCQVLLAMDDIPAAEEGIRAIEASYADDHDAMLAASRLYQTIGRTQKSIEILNELLVAAPENFALQKQATVLFLQQKDPALVQKGRHLLDEAIRQNPVDVQLRLAKARVLIQDNNAVSIRKAEEILLALTHEYPKLEAAWASLAQIAMIENDSRQAIDYVSLGLAYIPNSQPLLLLKAQTQGMRSPELAIDILERLHKQSQQEVAVVLMLAQNYRKADRPQEALKLLQDSLEMNAMKDLAVLQNELIAVLYETGRKEDADAMCRQLIEKTADPSVLLNWIELISKDGSPEQVRSAYQQWMTLYPESAETVLSPVLETVLTMNHPDKAKTAEEIVQTLLNERPESAVVNYSMAMLLHMTGRKVDAIPWYEKTIELDPKQTIAINNLAWILCTEKGEYQRALGYAQKGLAINPSYVDLIDTRGAIYMYLGEYEKAVEDFQRCSSMYFKTNPNRTVSVFNLGKCLLEMGRNAKAMIELMNAKDLDEVTHGLSAQQRQEIHGLIERASQID